MSQHTHHLDHLSPFELLREIERTYKERAAGLPQQKEIKKPWTGIGFQVGGLSLVAPVDDVSEILYFPKTTIIPGTKSWVRGMANVRGTLMPIIDLKQYLGHEPISLHARSRVLVIHHDEMWAGLLVDEVSGLKHFVEDARGAAQTPEQFEVLRQYLKGSYQLNETSWLVFSFKILAENPNFVRIAA